MLDMYLSSERLHSKLLDQPVVVDGLDLPLCVYLARHIVRVDMLLLRLLCLRCVAGCHLVASVNFQSDSSGTIRPHLK